MKADELQPDDLIACPNCGKVEPRSTWDYYKGKLIHPTDECYYALTVNHHLAFRDGAYYFVAAD